MTDDTTFTGPGSGTVIVGERAFALFATDPSGARPQAMAQLVMMGAPATEITSALTGSSAPPEPFAICVIEPDGVQLFLAMSPVALAAGDDGATTTHASEPGRQRKRQVNSGRI